MSVPDEREFKTLYRQSVDDVMYRMPEDWGPIANHNVGWRKNNFNARQYLLDSEVRFFRAWRAISTKSCVSMLDVGGFLAAFPLTMRRLGHDVTIAEKFEYYGGSLDGIAELLVENDINVVDIDFTLEGDVPDNLIDRFDAVTCMAVAEHLAHSPAPLMKNIHRVLRDDGQFVFEVPNLAYWPRRFSLFFRGRTVLAPIEEVYHSAVPFTGHHREYTLADARYVLKQGGFTVLDEQRFNYGLDNLGLTMQLFLLPARIFQSCAGVIFTHCCKS